MAICLMNNKGFMLVDALVNVIVVSSIAILCFYVYRALNNYDDGYKKYINENNEKYDYLYGSLSECTKCLIIEDSAKLEP